MGFEPRMRGPRFGRPPAKKLSSKGKKEKRDESTFYQEPELVDPTVVSSRILNALEHLGNQRFVLPPFSEHFQRWTNDITNVLTEFETQLPAAVDEQYHDSVKKVLTQVQEALSTRIEAEKNASNLLSDLQQRLLTSELEISKLDRDYKTKVRDLKRRYERTTEKLQAEIDSADKQRLRILRKRTGFLQRIFGRSDSRLEEESNVALKRKKGTLDESRQSLKRELEKIRIEYESTRQRLVEKEGTLRSGLDAVRGNALDDALDARKLACEELRRAIAGAVEKFTKAALPKNI